MAKRRNNRKKSYKKSNQLSLLQKIFMFVQTPQGIKCAGVFIWFVYLGVVAYRTDIGASNIVEWAVAVFAPIAFWYYLTMRRQQMIHNRSIAYVQALELIEKFRPSQHYDNEIYYHQELFAHLNRHMPDFNMEMEEAKGSTRPDIVIDHSVSIEVKGPTGPNALDTLGDKCLRYATRFDHVIIVCFAVFARETRYYEVDQGIKRQFPNIVMVRIDKDQQGRTRKYNKVLPKSNAPAQVAAYPYFEPKKTDNPGSWTHR